MKTLKILGTILIIGMVVFLAAGCSSKSTTTVKTQPYTVQTGSLAIAITSTGNLALSRTEDLAFAMAGTVEQVLVTEGETVKEGQELVKLDTSEWETQLKTLEKALTTAERNLTAKEKALRNAQQTVTTKESAVSAAERQVTEKELAVQQAELDVQSANYTLSQISIVKEAQDTVDNAESALEFAKTVVRAGNVGGLTGNLDYWLQLKAQIETQLAEAKADLQSVLDGSNINVSRNIALQVAQDQLAVTKSQMALDTARQAVADAKSAINDAELAVEDAKSAVMDAQLDVEDAQAAVADAQDALDEAKNLSPIITAPFDGFITRINVVGGDEIMKGTIAMVIADPDRFSAKILVTEDDIASVKLDGEATVAVTALSDVTLPAKVTKISPTATVSSGVVNYSVTVNITSLTPISTITVGQSATMPITAQSGNQTMPAGMPPAMGASGNFTPPSGMASGNFTMPGAGSETSMPAIATAPAATENVTLMDGLSAIVEIISQQKSDILIIPSKAITRLNGQSTVQLVNGNATETRVIQTGMTDGSYTEVTSGLSEGEVIRYQTSASSSSSSSSSISDAQRQIQSLSGGGPGGPPPGGF